MTLFQRTLGRSVSFSGIGLHSGVNIHVEIRPASANSGIVFQRTDLPEKPYITATPEAVFDTSLATRIGSKEVFVSTIEHLMAAFFGLGIDNAVVAVSSYEVPILDGSSAPFLVLLDEAGISELNVPRKIYMINEVIEVIDEKDFTRFIRIEPSKTPLISYSIDYAKGSLIQTHTMNYNPHDFCREFAFARTFCLEEEIQYMHSKGLAKGGSIENALVFSSKTGAVLNTNGLRDEREFVKHKILDCIGDLALLGASVFGHVIANKAGHDLHTKLAKQIIIQKEKVNVLVPSSVELERQPDLGGLLSFPRSLLEMNLNFKKLPVG